MGIPFASTESCLVHLSIRRNFTVIERAATYDSDQRNKRCYLKLLLFLRFKFNYGNLKYHIKAYSFRDFMVIKAKF